MHLKKISSVTIRYTFPDDSRKFEIRQGSIDGDLVGEIEVKNSGGWDNWTETSIPIKPTVDRADLFVVVSAAVNFDWLRFSK